MAVGRADSDDIGNFVEMTGHEGIDDVVDLVEASEMPFLKQPLFPLRTRDLWLQPILKDFLD